MRDDGPPLTLLGITRRNLYRQPVRTALTSIGVAIGVVAIVAVGSVARGLRASVGDALLASGSDLMVAQAGTAFDIFSVLDEEQTRAVLQADPDVDAVSAGLWYALRLDDKRGTFVFVIGVRPGEFGLEQQENIAGKRLSSENEVMLGVCLAPDLGKDIGDEIVIQGRTLEVCGTFETGVVYFDKAVVMHLDLLQTLTGRTGSVSIFNVRLKPGRDRYAFAERFEREHPDLAAIADAQQYDKIDQGMRVVEESVWLLSALALAIGALIVSNTMWMSVNHRTREIGVFRAVGWSRGRITRMILVESSYIGVIASILGCVCGVALCEASVKLPFLDGFVDPVYNAQTFSLAVGTALGLSILGAILPAIRAASISPAEALRHE